MHIEIIIELGNRWLALQIWWIIAAYNARAIMVLVNQQKHAHIKLHKIHNSYLLYIFR